MRTTILAAAAMLSLGLPAISFAAGGALIRSHGSVDEQTRDAGRSRLRASQGDGGARRTTPAPSRSCSRSCSAIRATPTPTTCWAIATRASGNPNGSLQYYQQALAIDPKHLGAHEYLGEAYLMLDQPAEADKMLARLDSLCVFGCTEYRMLKTAIANYKQGKKPTN